MHIDIHAILHWLHHNWFQWLLNFIAIDNIIMSGAKAAGWTKLETICQQIGNFISGCVSAIENRNQTSKTGG